MVNMQPPLLEVENLGKHYPLRGGALNRIRGTIKAVDGVSFTIREGTCLGLVGESGSGKSTIARCILRLEDPTFGRVRFDGSDTLQLSTRKLRQLRARMQIVFQDPYASLNPRMTAHDIIAEPFLIHKVLQREELGMRVVELLQLVGMGEEHLYRYPHEFSGGQRQRICIARALALHPRLVILDEPTSALDVSVQAQILNLLDDLQRRLKLTYLLISHDLGVIGYICDRVAVIRRGRIVEEGETEQVLVAPKHPYTRDLVAAMPLPDPELSPFRRPT